MFHTIAAVSTTERGCACVRARRKSDVNVSYDQGCVINIAWMCVRESAYRKSDVNVSYNRGCVINSTLAVCTGAAQTKVDRAGAEQKRRKGCGSQSLRCGMRGVGVSEECVSFEVPLVTSCSGPSLTHVPTRTEHISPSTTQH